MNLAKYKTLFHGHFGQSTRIVEPWNFLVKKKGIMSSFKITALRDALLRDTGIEERVEVNQRHLIDKILARYSAEFTVFRELLQNSNDAGAESVQIIFETNKDAKPRPSLLWSSAANVKTITYRNNGRPFSEEDFARLRKIAEGNPDETKIGFFGVGFYSLFSLCEEPVVTSGKEMMCFLWRNDMLYTKKGRLPPESVTEWTVFFLNLRETMDVPKTGEFGRFLATSMAFTTHIKAVEVFVDDERVLCLSKSASVPQPLDIAKNFSFFSSSPFTLSSPNNFMQLESVYLSKVQLDVQIIEGSQNAATIHMRIATGTLNVTLPRKLVDEMVRTTKKAPPSTSKIMLMFSNYDEYDASSGVRGGIKVFDDLVPLPTEQGKIFIGFPTHQTTGCAIQLAGHFIPTVERESIDFVDRSLNLWNQEILSMGGLLARIVFEDDLNMTQALFSEMKLDADSRLWLEKKTCHTLNSFTFKPSTPSPFVGNILSTFFFKLSSLPIRICSTKGILPVSEVRIPDESMRLFISTTPVMTDGTMEKCKKFVQSLMASGLIRRISFEDVLKEISGRAFSSIEVIALFEWWVKLNERNMTKVRAIQQNLIIHSSDADTPIAFAAVTKYSRPGLVPSDLPLPPTVMPLDISRVFVKNEFTIHFWNITEFTILEWVQFICTNEGFGTDAIFTEKVMETINRHYQSSSSNIRTNIISLLSAKKCVLTQTGLILPQESYFNTVTLFDDLPKVSFSNPHHISAAFLKDLGVRETVELQLVFNRLNNLNWDQVRLIKYLASVQSLLSNVELKRLSVTPLFLLEMPRDSMQKGPRRLASDIYAPIETFKSFKLPVLLWTGKWKSTSEEARFMKSLGLRSFVPVDELIQASASAPDSSTRHLWVKHFVENYDSCYRESYNPSKAAAFIPTDGSPERAVKPTECYSDSTVAVMGFNVLHPAFRSEASKLGVKASPASSTLLQTLQNMQLNIEKAPIVLTFLGTQQINFSNRDWAQLKAMRFIPVQRDNTIVYASPQMVYFGIDKTKEFANHFMYVDFGTTANAFLRACGVKEQPTPMELAENLVKSPRDFLDSSGIDVYMGLLRQIAANYNMLKQNSWLVSQMRNSAFLIGRVSGSLGKEDEAVRVKLAKASEIFLIDDTVLSQIFQPLGAPMDEMLEFMYHDLGSRWLSSNVKEEYSPSGRREQTVSAQALETCIHERASLLLYDGHEKRSSKDLQADSESILNALKVSEIQKISIVRTFQSISKTQNTTACIEVDSRSRQYISILVTKDFDYFDVASAIGKIVLRKPRLNDFLLISTLLSTTLENLKRKGFPIDRIMNLIANKSKAPPPVATIVEPAPTNTTLSRANTTEFDDLKTMFPDADPDYIQNQLKSKGPSQVDEIANEMLETGYPKTTNEDAPSRSSTQKENPLFDAINKFTGINVANHLGGLKTFVEQTIGTSIPSNTVYRPNEVSPRQTDILKSRLKDSISGLRPSTEDRFNSIVRNDNPTPLQQIRDRCDTLSPHDLTLVYQCDGVSFYVDQSVMDEGRMLVSSKLDALERFTSLLKFLADVFEVKHKTIQVYYSKGSTIAFNRSRSLFFNFHFYLGLHFQPRVPGGFEPQGIASEKSSAIYYWFLVYCHELAHNFVSEHNSYHEYWLSTFAEHYLGSLVSRMGRQQINFTD